MEQEQDARRTDGWWEAVGGSESLVRESEKKDRTTLSFFLAAVSPCTLLRWAHSLDGVFIAL